MESTAITFPILGKDFSLNPPDGIPVFGFEVRFYGIIIALGFILAALYALRRHSEFGLTKDNILDLVICAIPSAIVGARLYYIVFNASEYFGPGKWQNIIRFREGGLAVYGGVIGAVIAVFIYCRIKKVSFAKMADVGGLGLLIGQAVGRWGNFFNREAFGSVTNVPWRMGLETPAGTVYVHPAFLYESLWNVIGFVLLHLFSKKHKKYHGQIFLMYVAWYGLGRFFIEGLRTDSLFIGGSGIRVSQLLAGASFVIASVILVLLHIRGVRSTPDEPDNPDETPESIPDTDG